MNQIYILALYQIKEWYLELFFYYHQIFFVEFDWIKRTFSCWDILSICKLLWNSNFQVTKKFKFASCHILWYDASLAKRLSKIVLLKLSKTHQWYILSFKNVEIYSMNIPNIQSWMYHDVFYMTSFLSHPTFLRTNNSFFAKLMDTMLQSHLTFLRKVISFL